MSLNDEKLALADFMVVDKLMEIFDSYLGAELSAIESYNMFKVTLQDLSTSERSLKERMFSRLRQALTGEELDKDRFKSCAINMRDLLVKEFARTIKLTSLEELSTIKFYDAAVLFMECDLDKKELNFKTDISFLHTKDRLIDFKGAEVTISDWTDYHVIRRFSVCSGKNPEFSSDYFEPILDLPYFRVFEDKKTVIMDGNGKYITDCFEYHFVNPKVSGTFECDRDPIS